MKLERSGLYQKRSLIDGGVSLKKILMAQFYGKGSTAWRLYSHYEGTANLHQPSPQQFLVLFDQWGHQVVLNPGL